MALIRTKLKGPRARILTDDDKLVIVRHREGRVLLHIEDLFDESIELHAKLRPDQAAILAKALTDDG